MALENSPPVIDLIVEGQRIQCDKALLMKKSEYFNAMFSSAMRESLASEIELKDASLTYDIVKSLVDFMLTGELDVGMASELLETACMLQVTEAIDNCSSYLALRVNNDNCLSLMLRGDMLALSHLYNVCRKHALLYFLDIAKGQEFLELEKPDLIAYVSDKTLNCGGELEIFLALKKWVENDCETRKDDMIDLLNQCFHPEDLTSREIDLLKKTVHSSSGLLSQDFVRFCKNVNFMNKDCLKRPYRACPVSFVAVGMSEQTDESEHATPCNTIYWLSSDDKIFNNISKIPVQYPEPSCDIGYRACVVGDKLYVTGGEEKLGRNTWRMDVLCYSQGHWTVVTRLPSVRRHHAVCSDRQSFYLLGGFGRFRQKLSSVQQYNTITDEWSELPDMPYQQVSPKTTIGSDAIYTLGDENDLHVLSLSLRQWTKLSMQQAKVATSQLFFSCLRWYHEDLYAFVFTDSEERVELVQCSLGDGHFQRKEVLYTFAAKISDAIFHDGRVFVFEGEDFVSYELSDFTKRTFLGKKPQSLYQFEVLKIPDYPVFRKETKSLSVQQ